MVPGGKENDGRGSAHRGRSVYFSSTIRRAADDEPLSSR